MAINFPNSPALNDVFADSDTGSQYQWNGTKWTAYNRITSNVLSVYDSDGSLLNPFGMESPSINVGYTGSGGGYTGSIGFTGSASTAPGYTGSGGTGFTGSVGFTGSASTTAGPAGFTGSVGTTGFTGSAGTSGVTTGKAIAMAIVFG